MPRQTAAYGSRSFLPAAHRPCGRKATARGAPRGLVGGLPPPWTPPKSASDATKAHPARRGRFSGDPGGGSPP
eukprot:12253742-Alexandrium_andersonii.AAC.1